LKGTNKKEIQELLNGLKEDFYLTVYNMPLEEYESYMKELFKMVDGKLPLKLDEKRSSIHLREILPNKYNSGEKATKQTANL
jgi:hypothetical protein